MENRWEHLDEEYADEKPFVKIRTGQRSHEEPFIEKPTKAQKKGRKLARQMKEFRSPSPREDVDD